VKEGARGEAPVPPYVALRDRLVELVRVLDGADRTAEAEMLRGMLAEWWREQQQWDARLSAGLGLHHEINNALVGVRGNTQLLLMGPAGQQPGTRERLEVVIRESGRIQEAAGRLRELKLVVGGPGNSSLAA
jgi:nitrogen-specific signal transduction histidine kinase